jgi:chemotaxis protein MotB
MNITVGTAPMVKEDIKFEMLRNVALKNNMESEMSITKQLDRTILSISNKVLFKPGSYQLNPDSTAFLSDLTDNLIKHDVRLIEIRGFTDNADTLFKEDPLKYSMYLSTKRANAVFNFLKEKGGIPTKKMVAHGFGRSFTGHQSSKEKTGLNRHVEIILDDQEKIPFQLKRLKKKGSLLDFKGFLFRVAGDGNDLYR